MINDKPPESTETEVIDEVFQQALRCHKHGQLQEANNLYHAILEIQPDHADANYNLGVLMIQQKQPASGLPYFTTALAVDPTCVQYWLSYIDALIQAGQQEEARQVLAFARQQGLKGDEVEALAVRLQDSARSVEQGDPGSLLESGDAIQGATDDLQGDTVFPKDNNLLKNLYKITEVKSPDQKDIDKLLTILYQGHLMDAANLAGSITKAFPRCEIGWKVLGVAYKQMGRSADALAPMQKAALLAPDDAEAHSNLGATLHELGRLAEAKVSCMRALELKPDYAQAHNNLANVLKSLGHPDEAVVSYRRAIEFKPDFVEAYYSLSMVLYNLGRVDEAEACCRRALNVKPDCAEAYRNLGNLLFELDRTDEARGIYLRAIEIKPDLAEVHINLGILHAKSMRMSEAEASFHRALQIKPDCAEAYSNLGNLLCEIDRLDEARSHCLRAIELKPDSAEAYTNLGNIFAKLMHVDEAEASFRKAIELKPNYAEAYNNLGNLYTGMCYFADAEASFRRALQLKPGYKEAYSNLLFTFNYHPDLSAEDIYSVYQEYNSIMCTPLRSTWHAHDNYKDPDRRLRVGYVSPDFRHHSCRYFLEPLLEHHDKAEVEVYAYAELGKEDYMTVRYKTYIDHWIPTKGMSDEELAERIREDGIDILVDLAGHTGSNRLLTFARKPAPISIGWLGYGYTTGLTAIDYYLTDEVTVPPGYEKLFAEQPWRVEAPSYAYRPADGMGAVSSLPALERGFITFGTLSRSIRINHRTIRVWASILNAVLDSRLIMDSLNFSDLMMQEKMAACFAEYGISRDRLEIGFHSPPWNTLRSMDIGLDCFPHNSGTTLVETLYMGVPYITLAGRPSVGRLGSSVLHGVGHPEWIAQDEDEYVAKAVELAGNVARLSEIRSSLRKQMESSSLMDEEGFARKVEDAYRKMWKIWCERGDHS